MSKDDRNTTNYEVGYGKPPKSTQFKKGRSGNPSGRPKRSPLSRQPLTYELTPETFKDTFLEEAYRMVNINTGGGEQSIPIARAVTRALGVKAAKGHIYAQRLFAQTLIALEAEKRKTSEDLMEGMINYKRIWSEELQRRESCGLPIDPPVPHPDDVVFSMSTGTLEVRGPLSQEEKDRQDYYADLLEEWQDTKALYEHTLAQPIEIEGEEQHREFIAGQLEQCKKMIPMLKELSGQGKPPTLFEAQKRAKRIE